MRAACGLVLLALVLPRALGAAVIDTGFTTDGKATYCQGPVKDEGPLVFEDLAPTSIGKCPINVQMTLSAPTVAVQGDLDVKWFATIQGGKLPVNLLPNVANLDAKTSNPVKSSMIRACPINTNCAAAGVVVPTAIAGDTNTDDGAFDSSGTKQLKSYRFKFATAGKYIVVGVVSIMGDKPVPAEFVSFATVEVSDAAAATPNTTAPATTTPPTEKDADPPISASTPMTTTPPTTTAPAKKETGEMESGVKSSSGGGGGGINWQTVGIVAVVAIVLAVAFVLNYERRDLKRIERARAFQSQRTPQSPGRSVALRSDAGLSFKTSMSKPTGSPLPPPALSSPKKKTKKALASPRSSQATPHFPILRATNAQSNTSSYDQRSSRMQSNVFQVSIDSVEDVGDTPERPRRSTVALLEASPTGSDAWSIGSLQDHNAELASSRPSHYSFL